MLNRIKYLIFLLMVAASLAPFSPVVNAAEIIESGSDVVVEAEGQGTTKMEALKAAWMEAVRLGIGMFLTAKTTVIDENIKEEIVSHSRGKVNAYEELSSVKEDGVWKVKIRAKIEKDILQETATTVQNKAIKVDMKGVAASTITSEQNKADAKSLIDSLIFPENVNDLFTIDVNKEIKNNELYVFVTLRINEDFYNRFIIDTVQKIIDQIAISKSSEIFDTKIIDKNKKVRQGTDSRHNNDFMYLEGPVAIFINDSEYISYKINQENYTSLIYKILEISPSWVYCDIGVFAGSDVLRKERIRINFKYTHRSTIFLYGGSGKAIFYPGFDAQMQTRKEIKINLSPEEMERVTDVKAGFTVRFE